MTVRTPDFTVIFDAKKDVGVPYFTKAQLREANDEAVAREFNRQLKSEPIEALPTDFRVPVTLAAIHYRGAIVGAGGRILRPRDTTPQIRCRVVLDHLGNGAYLDITPERFGQLPRFIGRG